MVARNDARVRAPHHADELIFSNNDMQEAFNEWRKAPNTWMKPESLHLINAMDNQAYHQACKSRFSTMLFQLFGNKALVELFVRFPVCSAEQPAELLNKFARCWETCTNSSEVRKARDNARPSTEARLSKQIGWLKYCLTCGADITDWIAKDWNRWYQLSTTDQSVWYEYNSGNIEERVAALRRQQRPKFPGIAETLV